LARIRQSLLHVRVCNNRQSQGDAIVGRAVVGLRNMHADGFDSEQDALAAALTQTHAAAEAKGAAHELTPEACAELLSVASPSYAYRGHPHTLHFEAAVTFAGVGAGTISGSVTIVWKRIKE
jgi:hypothetical protein